MGKTPAKGTTVKPSGKKKVGKLEDGYCPPKAPPSVPAEEPTGSKGKG